MMSNPIRILFVAADPSDESRLRLGKEFQVIKDELARKAPRGRFALEAQLSTKLQDLTGQILHFRPHVVHFAGHGTPGGALVFEDAAGKAVRVSASTLERLFRLAANEVVCVILNTCYSEHQATEIAKHIPYVVGLEGAVTDEAALHFSLGFYQALGAGKGVSTAFEFAQVLIPQPAPGSAVEFLLLNGPGAAERANWPNSEERPAAPRLKSRKRAKAEGSDFNNQIGVAGAVIQVKSIKLSWGGS